MAGFAVAKEPFALFGVEVKGDNQLLTKKLVMAASDAATAFGIQKQHTVEAVDGLALSRQFDKDAMNAAEHEHWVKSSLPPTQQSYILVTGVFGGGCVAIPTWSMPANKGAASHPVGITNMRCEKTDTGFHRLLKVAAVAMDI